MASSLKVRLEKQIKRSKKVNRPKRKKEKRTSTGAWRILCDTDPRWNAEGTSEMNGAHPPHEMEEKVKELTQKYGDPPPLRYEY